MALQKTLVDVPLAGIDQSSHPALVAQGAADVVNYELNKRGGLKPRPGYTALTGITLPSTIRQCFSYKDSLRLIADNGDAQGVSTVYNIDDNAAAGAHGMRTFPVRGALPSVKIKRRASVGRMDSANSLADYI
jgi:hypothetical protein